MLPYIKNKVASWRCHLLKESIDMNQKRCQASFLIQKSTGLMFILNLLSERKGL